MICVFTQGLDSSLVGDGQVEKFLRMKRLPNGKKERLSCVKRVAFKTRQEVAEAVSRHCCLPAFSASALLFDSAYAWFPMATHCCFIN